MYDTYINFTELTNHIFFNEVLLTMAFRTLLLD